MGEAEKTKLLIRLLKEHENLQFYDNKIFCKKQIAIKSKRRCGNTFRGERLFCKKCSDFNKELEQQKNIII